VPLAALLLIATSTGLVVKETSGESPKIEDWLLERRDLNLGDPTIRAIPSREVLWSTQTPLRTRVVVVLMSNKVGP
jgi:hypothetical protein